MKNGHPDFVTRQCAGISSCWRVAGSGGKRLARLLYIADFTLLNVGNSQAGGCIAAFFVIYLRHWLRFFPCAAFKSVPILHFIQYAVIGSSRFCMRCYSQNSVYFEVGVNCTPTSTFYLHEKSDC
ncbi:hypothetical protein T12_5154 [Trichinella patagoniensis]|uniref:Uncharacterized protein n=1 Tax=Trichinella patagoniensis TaxID=990121 RepID=A0A0V0ZV94_9BILA|nr:hypothetical protein T12_5154 [Trichinella patagoniensis]